MFYSAQDTHKIERRANLILIEGIWKMVGRSDLDLGWRIGHPASTVHYRTQRSKWKSWSSFDWQNSPQDFACIHCILATGVGKVPRPFGQKVHWTKPNDLVQLHNFEIGPSLSGLKYVFMIRNDQSDCKCFFLNFPTLLPKTFLTPSSIILQRSRYRQDSCRTDSRI